MFREPASLWFRLLTGDPPGCPCSHRRRRRHQAGALKPQGPSSLRVRGLSSGSDGSSLGTSGHFGPRKAGGWRTRTCPSADAGAGQSQGPLPGPGGHGVCPSRARSLLQTLASRKLTRNLSAQPQTLEDAWPAGRAEPRPQWPRDRPQNGWASNLPLPFWPPVCALQKTLAVRRGQTQTHALSYPDTNDLPAWSDSLIQSLLIICS